MPGGDEGCHDEGGSSLRSREGGSETLEGQRDACDVDSKSLVPFLEVEILDPAPGRHDPRIGDYNVGLIEVGSDCRHRLFGTPRPEIAGCLPPVRRQPGLRQGLRQVNDGKLCAGFVEALGDCTADPPAAAGDDCAAALEEGAGERASFRFNSGHRSLPSRIKRSR